MAEPSNEAVEAMVAQGRWPAEMERLLEAALPIERNRWEQEVRERLGAVRKELCFCPTGTDDKELCSSCEALDYVEIFIFEKAGLAETEAGTGRWTGVANIAWCPEHGLHGARDTCFECGKPVEQIPMVPITQAKRIFGEAELVEKKTPWSMAEIVDELAAHPEVRWDRFIEYAGKLRVYGWLDRSDGRSDFLLLDFDPTGGLEWVTSASPHPASVIERLESDDSADCKRVEDYFDIPNAVRLQAEPVESEDDRGALADPDAAEGEGR